ncbi:hypothetical protein [Azospirillum sp. SYSU D00513]|uniref:hypothetical protein n=1 Tax=Azospirillum sp. SYSU D00513 TaxID=2812561 RepID=UPI001A973754|nr:hypothetical protein [Azospirillum sp. SYSU D00513]
MTNNAVILHVYDAELPDRPQATRKVKEVVGLLRQERGEPDAAFLNRAEATVRSLREQVWTPPRRPAGGFAELLGLEPGRRVYAGELEVETVPTL